MLNISYNDYISRVSDETKRFVERFLDYLYCYSENYLYVNDKTLKNKFDKHFYLILKAYQYSSEENANFLSRIGFSDSAYMTDDTFSYYRERTFMKFSNYFIPTYEEELDYMTPEDIISKVYHLMPSDIYFSYSTISDTPSNFITKLEKQSTMKREKIKDDIKKDLLGWVPIATSNYLDTAGELFYFIRKNTPEELFNVEKAMFLSLLLAVYHYENVYSQRIKIDMKNEIIDYFASKGLSEKLIKTLIPYEFKISLSNIDSTFVLNKYYKSFINGLRSNNEATVPEIVGKVIKKGVNNDIFYNRELLAKCGLTVADLSDLKEVIDAKMSHNNVDNMDSLYNYLSSEVTFVFKEIARYYAYFNKKEDKLNDLYVKSEADKIALATFLTALKYDTGSYKDFFNDKGVNYEKVLSLMGLPNEIKLEEKLEKCTPDESILPTLVKMLDLDFSSLENKSAITVNTVISNSCYESRFGSSLVKQVFDTLTNERLDLDHIEQINNYYDKKEGNRKRELEEKLFANVAIDVYDYLHVVCSYYNLLKNQGLSEVDHEQLSIILGASRYKASIGKYLDSINLTRGNLLSDFGADLYYEDKAFDVDLINTKLRPYIFDRDDDKITVYSIFSNAFNPKLVNTLLLRNSIYKRTGKDCTYFMDIEKILSEFDADLMISGFSNDAVSVVETATKIYDLIKDGGNTLNLVDTEDDIRELSILLSFFKVNDESICFFNHNGVDLEHILSIVGLPNDLLDKVDTMEVDKNRILAFEKYIDFSKNMGNLTKESLLSALLSDVPNKSQVLETLTKLCGSKYEYLVDEITNKRERALSSEEEYEVLVGEVVEEPPAIDDSMGITNYGLSIAKHTNYITSSITDLTSAGSIETSLKEINTLLKQVETEKAEEMSFLDVLFGTTPPPKKEYDFEVLDEVQKKVDTQITVLKSEFDQYLFIKKYIEEYIKKIVVVIDNLKAYEEKLKYSVITEDSNVYIATCQKLDRDLLEEVISRKIQTFEKTLTIMLQCNTIVHKELLDHFNTIQSLEISKNAIIPLIGMETLISKGKQSEKEAIELNSNLVDLLRNVVNKNDEAARENLNAIRTISIGSGEFTEKTQEIADYLSMPRREVAITEVVDVDQDNNSIDDNFDGDKNVKVKK